MSIHGSVPQYKMLMTAAIILLNPSCKTTSRQSDGRIKESNGSEPVSAQNAPRREDLASIIGSEAGTTSPAAGSPTVGWYDSSFKVSGELEPTGEADLSLTPVLPAWILSHGTLMTVWNNTTYTLQVAESAMAREHLSWMLKNGYSFVRMGKDASSVVCIFEPGALGVSGGASSAGTVAAGTTVGTVAAGAVAVTGAMVLGYLVYDLVKTNAEIKASTKGWTESEKKDLYKGNGYWDNFCRLYGIGC